MSTERTAAQTRRLLYLLNATYTPEGVQVWLAHAERQGWPLDEQVRRAESLRRRLLADRTATGARASDPGTREGDPRPRRPLHRPRLEARPHRRDPHGAVRRTRRRSPHRPVRLETARRSGRP